MKSFIESKILCPGRIRTHVLRVTVVIKQKLVHILYNIDTTLISETKVVTFLLQQTPVHIHDLFYMPFTMYAFYHICLLPRMPFPTYAFSHGLPSETIL